MADANLKLKQVRSPNGASRKQRESLKPLGLGRIGATAARPDPPTVLVEVS